MAQSWRESEREGNCKESAPCVFFFPEELFRESYLYNDSWAILERVFTSVQFPEELFRESYLDYR